MDAVERWYAKTQKKESERVARFLEKQGMVWSTADRGRKGEKNLEDAGIRRGAGGAGADGTETQGRERLDVALKLSQKEVKAGELVAFSLEITNRGKRPLHRVGGVLFAGRPWVDGRELVVGEVAPGESRSAKATLQVPLDVVSHVMRVDVELITHGENTGVRVSRLLKVVGRRRPRFRYLVLLDDEARGNGNGILEPGEQGYLAVVVQNDGGEARDVRVDAVEATDPVLITKPRVVMDPLKAFTWAVAKMPVSFSRRGEGGSVPEQGSVTLSVYDRYLGGHLRATVPVASSFSAFGCKPVLGHAKAVGRVTLRQAARDGAAIMGTLEPGVKIPLAGRCGSWFRVVLEGGAPVYVHKNEISRVHVQPVEKGAPAAPRHGETKAPAAVESDKAKKKSTKKAVVPSQGLSLRFQVVPPRVFLKLDSSAQGRVPVSGRATHSEGVKDLWVATWSLDKARPQADKVHYARSPEQGSSKRKTLRFKTEVDERGGAQMVAVVARSTGGIKAVVRQAFYSGDESVKSQVRVGDTSSTNGGPTSRGEAKGEKSKKSSGCGCQFLDAPDERLPQGWLLLALLATLGWARRRRRAL